MPINECREGVSEVSIIMKTIDIIVPEENAGERLDRFLAVALEEFSRSYLQRLIREGHVTAAGNALRQNHRVRTDEEIRIVIPEPEPIDLAPQDIPLAIIYQDASLAVINKQAGLAVHPGPGNRDGTLVHALLFHIKDLSSIGGMERPGIVHRLDKDTAGLMVVAKTDAAHHILAEAFANRRVKKRYAAVVVGRPPSARGSIGLPIGRHQKYRHKMAVDEKGREARTDYAVKRVYNCRLGLFSLLDLDLHTGRTHQIRVHLSALGCPVVGDPIYSKKWEKYRVPFLLLASVGLEFEHPDDGRVMRFEAEMPGHMKDFIAKIEKLPLR